MKKTILLIISFILLLTSVSIFIYLKSENKNLSNDILELENNITNVDNKIKENKETKDEKQSEYEKLKEELKEKIEELEIWKSLEEKLNTALSS